MLQGIDISQRVSFSCKNDKDPKTIFILRPLAGIEAIEVQDRGALDIVCAGITKINNPDIEDSEKIKKFISSLKVEDITEIVIKQTSLKDLTDKEVKN